MPDFPFFSTGEVVAAVGATPAFVDVLSNTLNISFESLRNAYDYVKDCTRLTSGAVIPVDLFGQFADYTLILPFCDEHDLLVLEDGAQGFDGAIGNKRSCSFGNIITNELFPTIPLATTAMERPYSQIMNGLSSFLRSYASMHKENEIGWCLSLDELRVGNHSGCNLGHNSDR